MICKALSCPLLQLIPKGFHRRDAEREEGEEQKGTQHKGTEAQRSEGKEMRDVLRKKENGQISDFSFI